MSASLTRVHDVFDLAMRIGELMISNGAPAADVTATMLRVTASSGIRNVSVQVTLTEVSVSYLPHDETTPFTRIRAASGYTLDYTKLDAVDEIAHSYARGDRELHEARAAVERLYTRPRRYNGWITAAGWSIMGGACALYFGAGALVMVFAALTAGLLGFFMDVLAARRIPAFYTQIFGGAFAVAMAVLVHAIDPTVNSSLVVVACIILLLAGLTSVGAMQDAITGWYVTAAARLLETFVLTVGVVIGIRAGILAADMIGADIYVSAYLPTTFLSVLVVAIGGALIGFGYSVGVQVPPRLLPWTTALATMTALTSFLIADTGLGRVWAVGFSSALAGFFAVFISQRVKTPAMILAASSVITMVPGSVIYRGLLALGDNAQEGAATLFLAAEIAIAISTGVIFGELVATRIVERLPNKAGRGTPVISRPFATNRRRRMLTFGRKRRRPGALTTAIPVVHLDPGELDPTIAWQDGPAWREDAENLRPETQESGFELSEQALIAAHTGGVRALGIDPVTGPSDEDEIAPEDPETRT